MSTLNERLSRLTPEQREELLRRLGGGSAAAAGTKIAATATVAAPVPVIERDDSLSPSQQRMWLFEKMQGDSSAYNIASVLRVRGTLDADALHGAINEIVRRHENLRTTFIEVDGEPRQCVAERMEVAIGRVSLEAAGERARRDSVQHDGMQRGGMQNDGTSATDIETALETAIQRLTAVDFALDRGPLLRISIIHIAPGDCALVATIHHIIADGWSLRLLERELTVAYTACLRGEHTPVPVPAVQYRDYVAWQRNWLRDGGPRQLAYWKRQLEGASACWPMPTEHPRDTSADLSADTVQLPLLASLCTAVRALAEAEKASAFMVLAAAFKLVLGVYAGTDDISLGTPVANRRESRFDQVIGLFSNTVVLRTRIGGGSFRGWLAQVKEAALGAFQHQDIPFEQVVDAVRPERSSAFPPLFQVLFALHSTEASDLALPGVDARPVHLPRRACEFDLIFEFFLSDAENHAALTWRTALFADATIRRLQQDFLRVLAAIVADPDITIEALQHSLSAAPARGALETHVGIDVVPGAALLSAHCALQTNDRVLCVGDVPASLRAAARAWSASAGATCDDCNDDRLTETLLRLRPTALVLGPQAYAQLRPLAVQVPDVLADCTLILMHGDTPSQLPSPSAALWQVWGDIGMAGPCLLRRAGDAFARHRGIVGCVNALGQPLPLEAIGELTLAADAQAAPCATGLRGRLCADGVRIDGYMEQHGWIEGQRIDLDSMAAALLRLPGIVAAAVLTRCDRDGVWRAIGYVVPSQKVSVAMLEAQLRERDPDAPRPFALVAVNRIPRGRDGRVDAAALAGQPVFDAGIRAETAAALDCAVELLAVAWATPPANARLTIERPVPRHGVDLERQDGAIVPALSVGEPLVTPHCALSLAAMLQRAAQLHGDHGVTYINDASGDAPAQSYRVLLDEASRAMGALRAAGLGPGQRVLLQFTDNRKMLTAFWACVLCGAQPIPVAVPASGDASDKDLAKIVNAWPTLALARVLTSTAHADKMAAMAAALGIDEVPALALETLLADAQDAVPADAWHTPDPDDTALLLLTSGSTGMPKAVIQSHSALVSRSAATAQRFGFDADVVSFNWMPLDHVGGLVMFHLLDVYLGARQIQCATGVVLEQPLRWIEWLSRYCVTNTWAPNFAYALVNDLLAMDEEVAGDQAASRDWDLSALTFVLNGGESIVPRTARSFLRLLAPHGLREDAMKPAWGMSETCSGVTFNDGFTPHTSADSDSFVSVGHPIPGVYIRIVDGDDRTLPEGHDGRLQIRGPSVTSGYLNNADATSSAFTADGWYVTGDLAVLRNGALTITGREKDLIIVNGVNYYGHEIEQVVESVEDVLEAHVAACGVRRCDDNTDRLAVFFSVHARAQSQMDKVRADIAKVVLERVGIPVTHLVPMAPEELPRTSIGKIQRPQLAQRFNAGEFDARLGMRGDAGVTLPAWFYSPVWVPVPVASPGAFAFGDVLLFGATDEAATTALATAMVARGARVVVVRDGQAFARTGEDAFVADIADAAQCARVLEALQQGGAWRIVHCGGLSKALELDAVRTQWIELQRRGLLSLLAVTQALQSGGFAGVESLDLISRQAFAVQPGETPAVEHGGLQGMLRSLAQELPQLRCRQIDIDAALPQVLPAVLTELALRPDRDAVALRNGRRYVQMLRSVEVAPEQASGIMPDEAGLCLITGGLGGIGSQLAEWLLRHTDQHVLLIGRSSADAVDDQKRAARARLSAYGARFAYRAQDVRDRDGLAALVEQAEREHARPLHRVFHLAGTLHEAALADECAETLFDTLDAKALGAIALHEVLQARPEVDVVHFGSVNGYFGGVGVAAYAAANSLLDALAAHRRASDGRARCLSWSMWDDTGMSRGYGRKALVTARGFALLEPASGMDSLRVALAAPDTSVLIGLDGGSPNIARHVDAPPVAYWHLRAATDTAGVEVRDAFGTRFVCRSEHDDNAAQPGNARADQATMTSLERQLASIWQDVLRLPVTHAAANFFELGGDSIMAIQVVARAGKAGLSIAPRSLFECQTLADLARAVTTSMSTPVQSEQGVLAGDVPLGPTQAWCFDLQLDDIHHMNQSVLLRLRSRMDTDTLGKALSAVVRQHDMLRARFTLDGERIRQTLSDAGQVTVGMHRLDYTGAADHAAAIHAHCSRIQASLDLEHGPLLRAEYLCGHKPQDDRLLLAAHHLVVDGVSWRIIIEALEQACAELEAGASPSADPKSSSYRQWVAATTALARSTQGDDEAQYWAALGREPTHLPPLDSAQAENRRGAERSVEAALDRDATLDLIQRLPAATGLRIDELLLAALQRAHARWTGVDELYLTLEGHGRAGEYLGIDVSRTVGWFTSVYPVRLHAAQDAPLLVAAAAIRDQLAEVPNHGNLFNALRHLGNDATRALLADCPRPAISFNYLGRFDVDASRRFSFAPESQGDQLSPRQQRIHEIDVVGAVLEDTLRFSVMYCADRYRAATVQGFADAFADALRALVADTAAAHGASLAIPDALRVPLAALGRGDAGAWVERVFPASAMQTGLIYESMVSGVDGAYVSHLVNELSGRLDADALRRAWQAVVDRHDVYRSGFLAAEDGRYHAIVARSATLPWIALDWRGLSADEQETRFEALVHQDGLDGFDLATPPLVRIHLIRMADERYRMLLSEHHAVSDGWSRGIVLAEVGSLYRSFASGADVTLTPAHSFHRYIEWLSRFDSERARSYWTQYLNGLQLTLGYAGQKSGSGGMAVGRWHGHVDAAVSAAVAATARTQRTTLSAMVQTAWSLTMAAHTGSDDVAFLTTHSGRPSDLADVESIVGPFIQTVPVRLNTPRLASVVACARALQSMQADRGEYGHMPLFEICTGAGRKDLVPGFHTFFVFENFPLTVPEADEDGLRVDWVKSLDRTASPLMVMVVPGERLELLIYYRSDLFDKAAIDELCADFELALAYVAAAPEGGVHAQDWLAQERIDAIDARLQTMSHAAAQDATTTAPAAVATTTYEF